MTDITQVAIVRCGLMGSGAADAAAICGSGGQGDAVIFLAPAV
jgi:hypothetical protein